MIRLLPPVHYLVHRFYIYCFLIALPLLLPSFQIRGHVRRREGRIAHARLRVRVRRRLHPLPDAPRPRRPRKEVLLLSSPIFFVLFDNISAFDPAQC